MDAANTTPHSDRTKLLDDIEPWHIGMGLGLLWLFLHPQSAIPGMALAWLVWSYAERSRKQREAAARVGAWANICAAQIIRSYNPSEGGEVIAERAKQFRENLPISGNIYWQEIPIVEYPYNPMVFEVGTLSCAWDIYCRMCGEVQHIENMKWVEGKCPKELRSIVLSQVMPQPKNVTE